MSMKCGVIKLVLSSDDGVGGEAVCGKRAKYILDAWKTFGYPMCADCARHAHSSRIKEISPEMKDWWERNSIHNKE